MNRRLTLAILAAVASSTALAAYAQSAKTVAGTYSPVTVSAYGDKPKGQMILTPDGRYSIVLSRNDLAKIAAQQWTATFNPRKVGEGALLDIYRMAL